MKVSFWGILFVILGILGIVMINFFGNLTVSNEQNYYLLKEITEAAMRNNRSCNDRCFG